MFSPHCGPYAALRAVFTPHCGLYAALRSLRRTDSGLCAALRSDATLTAVFTPHCAGGGLHVALRSRVSATLIAVALHAKLEPAPPLPIRSESFALVALREHPRVTQTGSNRTLPFPADRLSPMSISSERGSESAGSRSVTQCQSSTATTKARISASAIVRPGQIRPPKPNGMATSRRERPGPPAGRVRGAERGEVSLAVQEGRVLADGGGVDEEVGGGGNVVAGDFDIAEGGAAEEEGDGVQAVDLVDEVAERRDGFYFGERGAPQVGAGSQAGAEVAAEVLLSGRLLLVGVSGEVVEEEAERARRGVIVAAATR